MQEGTICPDPSALLDVDLPCCGRVTWPCSFSQRVYCLSDLGAASGKGAPPTVEEPAGAVGLSGSLSP